MGATTGRSGLLSLGVTSCHLAHEGQYLDHSCHMGATTGRSGPILAFAIGALDGLYVVVQVGIVVDVSSIRDTLRVSRSYVNSDDGGAQVDLLHSNLVTRPEKFSVEHLLCCLSLFHS